jgi:hypothetical protein
MFGHAVSGFLFRSVLSRRRPVANQGLVRSLATAEMHLCVCSLVQQFDFEFKGTTAGDFEWESDQFVIRTKGRNLLKAVVKPRQH